MDTRTQVLAKLRVARAQREEQQGTLRASGVYSSGYCEPSPCQTVVQLTFPSPGIPNHGPAVDGASARSATLRPSQSLDVMRPDASTAMGYHLDAPRASRGETGGSRRSVSSASLLRPGVRCASGGRPSTAPSMGGPLRGATSTSCSGSCCPAPNPSSCWRGNGCESLAESPSAALCGMQRRPHTCMHANGRRRLLPRDNNAGASAPPSCFTPGLAAAERPSRAVPDGYAAAWKGHGPLKSKQPPYLASRRGPQHRLGAHEAGWVLAVAERGYRSPYAASSLSRHQAVQLSVRHRL